jgi:hypothetical protein
MVVRRTQNHQWEERHRPSPNPVIPNKVVILSAGWVCWYAGGCVERTLLSAAFDFAFGSFCWPLPVAKPLTKWTRRACQAPEGRLRIARRFSAGESATNDLSPVGTTEFPRTLCRSIRNSLRRTNGDRVRFSADAYQRPGGIGGIGSGKAAITGGWPTLFLISTPEGAPSLCLRSSQTQGGDFDSPISPPLFPNEPSAWPDHYARLHSSLIHHIRVVSAITDSIPLPCENHSQFVAAKRGPASRDGQTLPNSPFKICAGNKRSLTFSIPRAGLDKPIGTKWGQTTRKRSKTRKSLFRNTLI